MSEKCFGDLVQASAIIERLVHHAHIIKTIGTSYTIKDLQTTKINEIK